jgi:hypothetical protein
MGTKNRADVFSRSYQEAAPDEPLMVLSARDVHAATCVELWASLVSDVAPDLAKQARVLAKEMREWRGKRT